MQLLNDEKSKRALLQHPHPASRLNVLWGIRESGSLLREAGNGESRRKNYYYYSVLPLNW